ERRFTLYLAVGHADLFHGLANVRRGGRPVFGQVHVFLLALRVLRVPGGQAHPVVVEAEDLVHAAVQVHHLDELVPDLLLGAIDVRVVHAHRTHAEQARERAGVLITITMAVFGEPQRQVAVAARPRRVDL